MYLQKLLCCMALLAVPTMVMADEYTLFNPVPDDKMRPMTTERPSKTDSTYSLDAGHIQLETSLFAHTDNNDDGVKTTQNWFGNFNNIRIGLNNKVDFQIVNDLYHSVNIKDKTVGTKENHEGFGDTQLRLKVNLMGNNPSDTVSLALLPFVKLPTNQDGLGNDKVEGGVELPFNFVLADGWNIGGETAVSAISQTDGSGYDAAYTNSILVGKSFNDKLSGYTEFFTYKPDQNGAKWQNTLDFGAVYAVNDNLHVDTGINFGVTNAADDVNYFVGVAYRY